MGVLKHFAPQRTYFATGVIFWSKGIETFLDKNCLIFLVKIFKEM